MQCHECGAEFDVTDVTDELPLFRGAVAGGVVGIVMFVVAIIVAILTPSSGDTTLKLGAAILFDLQFATEEHVTPFLFGMFEEVRPPESALEFLYLLAPLFLFTAAKLVTSYHEIATLADAAKAGASVVVGYFPIMLLDGLVVGDSAGPNFSLVGALFIAGVVYLLLFGALGGLAAGAFSASERRVGMAYGLGGFFLSIIGVFVGSYVYVDAPVEIDIVPRLFISLSTFVGVNGLSFGESSEAGLIPFLIVGGRRQPRRPRPRLALFRRSLTVRRVRQRPHTGSHLSGTVRRFRNCDGGIR